jgi:SAM-dependent methyltransferase
MGEIIPRPTPPAAMPFTGERLTTDLGGQTESEHLHRYLLAREWCRDKDVLDVASGEGHGTALLAQVARSAVGVESAPGAVAHAARSYTRQNLSFLRGDARALPLPDASRDVVVSFETIERFADQRPFLREVRRVLRAGGLFVVSTPDRDNYSPADTEANPRHVKELTGGEFEALLRSQFAEVSILLQRPVFGSVLFPTTVAMSAPLSFERRGHGHFEASVGLARPQYIVAFASDGPAGSPPPSVYIDAGRPGMASPVETAPLLNAAQARVHTAESEQARLRLEVNTVRDQIVATAASLEAARLELAAANGEVKGLLAASLMTERACTELRAHLSMGRCAEAAARRELLSVRTELAEAREATRRSEARIVNMLASHSWKVTGPLRRLSRVLYPRS